MKVKFLTSLAGASFAYTYNEVAEVLTPEGCSLCYTGAAEPVGKESSALYEQYKQEQDKLRAAELEEKQSVEQELIDLNPETLKAKAEELATKEATLAEVETTLQTKETSLAETEQEQNDRATQLFNRAAELDTREAALAKREAALANIAKKKGK